MATPGISVVFSRRVRPIMPAAPPKKAISTSQIVGDVRASNSDCAFVNGDSAKYSVEVARLMPANTPRLRSDCRIKLVS